MKFPIRLLLVDDHEIFREGVKSILRDRQDFEIVGEAGDGYEAVRLAEELHPDIILMDIMMPECSGLEATRRIIRELPGAKIVILTVSELDDDVFEAVKAGARGYLTKGLPARQMVEMLLGVARGEACFSGVIAAKILRELQQPVRSLATSSQEHSSVEALSPRELEVLRLVAKGLSNAEIASALYIAESTVKLHLRSILEKLHLHNRVQAALYAVRQGLADER